MTAYQLVAFMWFVVALAYMPGALRDRRRIVSARDAAAMDRFAAARRALAVRP